MSLVPYVHVEASLDGARAGDRVALSRDERHHLERVLRLTDGAVIEVADGRGGHASAALAAGEVRLTADAVWAVAPTPRLTVAQALAKGRKLDEVVRQLTELGVDRILPVEAERSVSQLGGERASRAVARWRAVARAAGEQSRRPSLPEVTELSPTRALADLVAADGGVRLLVTHPGAATPIAHAVVPEDRAVVRELVVAVGPEGGWTDAELDLLVAAGAVPVRLGPHVLRTEHAAAAACAVLAATSGRWA